MRIIRKCRSCRTRTVRPTVLPVFRRTLTRGDVSYTVLIDRLEVLQCTTCQGVVMPAKADRRIAAAFADLGY